MERNNSDEGCTLHHVLGLHLFLLFDGCDLSCKVKGYSVQAFVHRTFDIYRNCVVVVDQIFSILPK
jgi:hypothetical protein